jgi:hypothetical protein
MTTKQYYFIGWLRINLIFLKPCQQRLMGINGAADVRVIAWLAVYIAKIDFGDIILLHWNNSLMINRDIFLVQTGAFVKRDIRKILSMKYPTLAIYHPSL